MSNRKKLEAKAISDSIEIVKPKARPKIEFYNKNAVIKTQNLVISTLSKEVLAELRARGLTTL